MGGCGLEGVGVGWGQSVTLGCLSAQESQASWLDAVVPRLAEVLHLEDTPSIQMEVGMLVRDYPDIR